MSGRERGRDGWAEKTEELAQGGTVDSSALKLNEHAPIGRGGNCDLLPSLLGPVIDELGRDGHPSQRGGAYTYRQSVAADGSRRDTGQPWRVHKLSSLVRSATCR